MVYDSSAKVYDLTAIDTGKDLLTDRLMALHKSARTIV